MRAIPMRKSFVTRRKLYDYKDLIPDSPVPHSDSLVPEIEIVKSCKTATFLVAFIRKP